MQGTISFDGTLSGGITGGGGGGSEVTITPTLSSGTKIADYDIDGTPGELYAPTPEGLSAQAPLSITSGVISIDLSGYQEKLTAGSYISIDSDNNISCNPPITYVWYTPEPDVQQDVLIGKFTVNDVTQNVYAPSGGGSSWDYSTTEVNTGHKWIDGIHDIYNLVIPFSTQLTTNNWTKVATINDEVLAIIDARAINTSNYDFTNIVADFDENDGIYVNNRSTVAFTPTHIIVEYIKLS